MYSGHRRATIRFNYSSVVELQADSLAPLLSSFHEDRVGLPIYGHTGILIG